MHLKTTDNYGNEAMGQKCYKSLLQLFNKCYLRTHAVG